MSKDLVQITDRFPFNVISHSGGKNIEQGVLKITFQFIGELSETERQKNLNLFQSAMESSGFKVDLSAEKNGYVVTLTQNTRLNRGFFAVHGGGAVGLHELAVDLSSSVPAACA